MIYVYSAQVNRFQAKRLSAFIKITEDQFLSNNPRYCGPYLHTEFRGFRKSFIWMSDNDTWIFGDDHDKLDYYHFVVFKFDDNYPGSIKFDFELMTAEFGEGSFLPVDIHYSWVPFYHG